MSNLFRSFFPYVNFKYLDNDQTNSNASYCLVIKDKNSLRKWIVEFSDKIEGFSFVYKMDMVDVTGDFNVFMEDTTFMEREKIGAKQA